VLELFRVAPLARRRREHQPPLVSYARPRRAGIYVCSNRCRDT